MIELISCLIAFGIVFGIPYMISRKEQKIQERKNIELANKTSKITADKKSVVFL